MSIWTQDDIELVQEAIRTAVLSGFADLNLDGKAVRRYSLEDLRGLLKEMLAAASNESGALPHFGLRFTKLVPPGCG